MGQGVVVYSVRMKLARFWTKESGEAAGPNGRINTVARGWSNQSIEDARQVARDLAQRVATRLASGETRSKQYLYGDRPLPEPIIREMADAAVVTRNAYGSLVLNTRDLMFVDIDRQDQPAAAVPFIQRVADSNGLAARVYQTAAGYRALITSERIEAASPRSDTLLQQFAADPLYVRLCRMQESFRARLSAKPWRCGMPVPPVTFPFITTDEESRFRQWEAQYTPAAARYATCKYLTWIGPGRMDPSLEELIYFHDIETRASSTLPLA
jgi:hypothetical protein